MELTLEQMKTVEHFNEWWEKEGQIQQLEKQLDRLGQDYSPHKRPKKRARPRTMSAPPGFQEKLSSSMKKLKI